MMAHSENGWSQAASMLPVVWILGTSGVGKSTVGYRLMTDLGLAGGEAAFVDADQLRLAHGVRATETELVASALPGLDRGFRAAGARVLVVAGLADSREHLEALLPGVPRAEILAVHLVASPETIRERVRQRGWRVDLADEAVRYADRIDPGLADLRLETGQQSPSDLSAAIRDKILARLGNTPGGAQSLAEYSPAAPGRIIMLTGPGGAGLSTVGFQLFSTLARGGEPVGYLDTKQVGFLAIERDKAALASLRAANAYALASSLAEGGARTVVISGEPGVIACLHGLYGADAAVIFWLHASPAALADRITRRSRGDGPKIQGDDRIGLTGQALDQSIAAAIGESRNVSLRPQAAKVIDTTAMNAAEVADAVRDALSSKRESRG